MRNGLRVRRGRRERSLRCAGRELGISGFFFFLFLILYDRISDTLCEMTRMTKMK